jgi:hypothetical protein
VSLAQSLFESRLKHKLEDAPRAESVAELPENVPWQKLEGLARLKDFLLPLPALKVGSEENASNYLRNFLQPLDSASEQLRVALAAQW